MRLASSEKQHLTPPLKRTEERLAIHDTDPAKLKADDEKVEKIAVGSLWQELKKERPMINKRSHHVHALDLRVKRDSLEPMRWMHDEQGYVKKVHDYEEKMWKHQKKLVDQAYQKRVDRVERWLKKAHVGDPVADDHFDSHLGP